MLTLADVTHMVTPQLKRDGDKRAWSISVENTWVPFFMASNVKGETQIPYDVLGAPIRLAKNEDGTIKFSKAGRPMTRVHPVLAEQVKVCQEKYVADLQGFAGNVARELPDEYRAAVEFAQRAAVPVLEQMDQDVTDYLAELEAQKIASEVPTPSENGDKPKGRKEKAAA